MKDGRKVFTEWHWGNQPLQEFEIKPPSVLNNADDKKHWDDMKLSECGRAVEIHFSPFGTSPKKRDTIIRLPKKMAEKSHLAFDVNHPNQRLYYCLSKDAMNKMKREYGQIKNPDDDMMPLVELAEYAGGKHATDDYYDIDVKPLGIITNVVYLTDKKSDGLSYYIHEMGEETGIRPALGIASDGSLWIAGGDYTSPVAGITN